MYELFIQTKMLKFHEIDRIVEYATKCIYHLDLSGCRNIYLLQHVPEEVR